MLRRSWSLALAVSVAACVDEPPRIIEVALLAPTPDFEGPYRVVANVDDETTVDSVEITFTFGPPGTEPAEGLLSMEQTDPGRWVAALPKMPLGTEVAYRVRATAGSDTSDWPATPPFPSFTVGNVPSKPELEVLWPERGPSSGGTEVLLVGQDFRPGLLAGFGGTSAETLEVISRTQARVKTPPGPEGFVDVRILQPDGGEVTKNDGFFYFPSPRIDEVIPPSGPVRGGTRVRIIGAHFPEGASFSFGGQPAAQVVIVSPTEATALTPPHAAGFVTVRVEHPTDGFGERPNAYEYIPPPEVLEVIPDRGSDLGGTRVTIKGRFFQRGAIAAFDSTSLRSISFVDDETLTAITPPHPQGFVDVTVVNPDNQNGTLADGFFYFGPPQIFGVEEPYASVDGGASVRVIGESFEQDTVVTIDGVPIVCTFVSTTELACTIPPSATPGPVSVTVTNSDGRSDTLVDGLTYFRIRSVTPDRGPASGGTAVIVAGDFLPRSTQISFGAARASCTFVDASRLDCTTPPGPPNQFVDVSASPSGQGQTPAVLIDGYFYVPPPEIVSIQPNEGPIRGGTLITITGNFFQSGATITIGGLSCGNVVFVDAQHLTCVVPAHAPGRVDVTVTNPDGQSDTLVRGYNYVPVTFEPNWGLVDGFTTLTVRGIGFTVGAVVRIDGVPAPTAFGGPRELRAIAPAHALTGSFEVRVDLGAIQDVSPDRYSYRVYRDRSEPSMFGFDETSDPKIADFDGDGDGDLLYINGSVDLAGRAEILENVGGSFSASNFGLTQVGNEGGICDVDGDGDLDLTWGISGQTTPLFRNNGNLSFSLLSLPSNPADAFEAGFFDIDADGDCDLISLAIMGPDSVLINDGSGNFSPLANPIPDEAGFLHDHKIDVADFDDDGRPDIMVVVDNVNFGLPPDQRHRLYLNQGNGTFREDVRNTNLFLGLIGDIYDVRAGDLDLDGDFDLVMPAFNRAPIVLINDGTGRFDQSFDRLAQDARPDSSLLLEDLEGDGDLDLLLVSLDFNVPSALFLNDGQGFFFRAVQGEPQGAPMAYRAAFGDISGDDRGDLLFGAVFGDNRMFFAEE
jgi:hypothetical protein